MKAKRNEKFAALKPGTRIRIHMETANQKSLIESVRDEQVSKSGAVRGVFCTVNQQTSISVGQKIAKRTKFLPFLYDARRTFRPSKTVLIEFLSARTPGDWF